MAQTIVGETPVPKREERAMEPAYRHSLVESQYVPHTSLLSFVSGEPTLVEWYRGSYAEDEAQQAFEPDSLETYSSYKRINHLIVKLNGKPAYTFDNIKAESNDTINGFVLFDLVPNIGDLLIKDIGDGRAGLYKLTEQPEIFTTAADKCYGFEARLVAIVTQSIMDNLNSKVIEELHYQKDMAVAGGNAILTREDRDLNRELYQLQQGIVDEILGRHYFSDEDTIIVPNDEKDWLYDPYLAKFLSYVIPTQLMGMRPRICLLNVNYYVDSREQQEPITIWDMFYKGDFKHPKRYKQEFYVHPRESLLNTRMYNNVFYSKMDRVIVIHQDPAKTQTYRYTGGVVPVGPIYNWPKEPGKPYPYFFSDEFYNGGGTDLEKFVWEMWVEKTIDKKKLVSILDKYWDLTDVEKLYMGGIYLLAIRTALINSSNYT